MRIRNMVKHFVTFLSPGTFVSEETTQPINAWNVEKAVEMSRNINERHGALPYGFYFTTRKRLENDFDSKETQRSGTYFLGGKVLTLQDIKDKNDQNNKILISNMENNGWDKVIENTNSWKIILPLEKDDILLDYEIQK